MTPPTDPAVRDATAGDADTVLSLVHEVASLQDQCEAVTVDVTR